MLLISSMAEAAADYAAQSSLLSLSLTVTVRECLRKPAEDKTLAFAERASSKVSTTLLVKRYNYLYLPLYPLILQLLILLSVLQYH